MKKYYYIYKITFLKGKLKGKYYIGMHIGYKSDMINDRYFGSGIFCKDYYSKYPPVVGETIIKEILEVCESKEQLVECEKKWIGNLWETDDLCVNIKKGGDGGCGPHSDETIRKISKSNKGKKRSEETRRKVSESLKGHTPWNKGKTNIYTEETRRKQSESHKGKSAWSKGKKVGNWINNGIQNKMIKPELLEQYLAEGWVLGRLPLKGKPIWNKGKTNVYTEEIKQKMSEARKGTIHINNGIQNKSVKPEILEQYLAEGWVFGRLPYKKKAAKQAA